MYLELSRHVSRVHVMQSLLQAVETEPIRGSEIVSMTFINVLVRAHFKRCGGMACNATLINSLSASQIRTQKIPNELYF